ncbi:hypothetical protein [Micromonospora sp. CB01531]|uniref:hypothetical protein n=1 Tax=Micromonospora sp. CB01531 TaxID=1718947 RepID=UPI00093A4762|nr:hypothetical protein [Micromonospora sp. CB01531]OKI47255.1 hypothetical protein A6A27_10425 [Micromonospora sp. CB01531]
MPHRPWAIRTALAAGLAATVLVVPTPAPAATADPSSVEVAPAGVPAVALLAGPAPSTVTIPAAAPSAAETAIAAIGTVRCRDVPCPPHPADWTASTLAVLKQPHPAAELQATEQAGLDFPNLQRLHRVRPRSTLLTGRATHLDPRPA